MLHACKILIGCVCKGGLSHLKCYGNDIHDAVYKSKSVRVFIEVVVFVGLVAHVRTYMLR